ncbi:MAG: hypothetical protein A2620_06440 [Acidobacteria bacterium RIFCSPHIGHO2_01_FULL_67_28]|nr:MAG: hypothetical protein A2620_06440 [Acidobacteria bacterium RIFCSPHIGHO2_01_FULL_67_28]
MRLVSATLLGMGVVIVVACLLGIIKPSSRWLYPLSVIVLMWFAAGGSLAYRLFQRYVVDMSKGRLWLLETEIGTYLIVWCVSLIVVAGAVSQLHLLSKATR